MKTKKLLKQICAVLLGLVLSVSQIPVTGYIPVSADDDVAMVTYGGQTQDFGDLEEAIAKLKENSGSKLTLLKDVTTTEGIVFSDSKTYTIDFNGYGIMYDGYDDEAVIRASSGSAVNLIDSRTENRPVHYITLDIDFSIGVRVSDSAPENGIEGTDYIKVTGGYITGGTGYFINGEDYCGGGVYCKDENTVIKLNNISIVGNYADDGAGVYVKDHATFIMEGGTISNNEADYGNGGGVYVYDATFTMKDGTISNNEAESGGGVGVYNATFTMEDGTISYNKAEYGGGVQVYDDAIFIMEDGTISNNEAEYGGGVYVYNNATFTMEDGTISNNEADYGGGVYVNDATFTMEDGTISSNKGE